MSGPGVLVILPTLNEVGHIEPILEGIRRGVGSRRYAVCIIDDGSTDGTVDRVKDASTRDPSVHLIEKRKTSRGSERGRALKDGLRWGLEHTDLDVFVEMDGDLSHRTVELLTGIALLENGDCDVAIASKYLPESRVVNRPLLRIMFSRLCSIAVRTLISRRIEDYSNGYRFYTREAARIASRHRLRYDSPIYLSEVLALWLQKGLRVREFPSTYVGRGEGISKLRHVDLLKAALAIVEISARFHLGLFRERTVMPQEGLDVALTSWGEGGGSLFTGAGHFSRAV